MSFENFYHAVMADARFQSFQAQYPQSIAAYVVARYDAYVAEIQIAHSGRKTHEMSGDKITGVSGGNFIIYLSAHESAVRSRVTGLQIEAIRGRIWLEHQLKTMRQYLRLAYACHLSGVGKTKSEQDVAINFMLEYYDQSLAMLLGLLEIIDVVVADVDQAGYRTKAINDSVAAWAKREF